MHSSTSNLGNQLYCHFLEAPVQSMQMGSQCNLLTACFL